MAKEYLNGLTKVLMRVNFLKIISMGKEFTFGMMGASILDSG